MKKNEKHMRKSANEGLKDITLPMNHISYGSIVYRPEYLPNQISCEEVRFLKSIYLIKFYLLTGQLKDAENVGD